MKSNVRDFTKGNITKQLLLFTLPLFLSNLLQIVYSMVDMIVVGKVNGIHGTTAVAVGGDVSTFLTFVGIGFTGAGQVLIARRIGQKRADTIGKFAGMMFGFLLISALVISVVALCLRHTLLQVMNTPVGSYQGALEYSTICMFGLVFIYGYNIVSAILRGMGDSKHPLIFIAIAAVINIILDIVLVYFMDMGPAGAACATVISQATSFIISAIYLTIKRKNFNLNIKFRDFFRWEKQMVKEFVALGTPMAIKMAAIQVSKLFVNAFVNDYGATEPAVPAFAGIANKIASVSNLVSTALNQAGSTLVGQNMSAGKIKRVKKVLLNITVMSVIAATVLSLVTCLFPQVVFGLFAKADEMDSVMKIVSGGYLYISVLLYFGGAGRAIMNSLLNGSGNTGVNFATAILDGIVMRIGLALLFGLALKMEYYGFWLGDALAGFTPFFIGIVFYFVGSWRKKEESPIEDQPIENQEIKETEA